MNDQNKQFDGYYTQEAINKANKVGRQRRQHHIDNKTYNGAPELIYNISGEVYGVVGELIFEHNLLKRQVPFIAAPLFTANTKTLPEQDFLINGNRYEIKTIPPDPRKKRFMVNVNSTINKHTNKIKEIDYYICIWLHIDMTYNIMGAITQQQLFDLPVRDWNQGDAYWTYADQMPIKQRELWNILKEKPFIDLDFCKGI